jgi:Skp family chaperone for outer membrane proteins
MGRSGGRKSRHPMNRFARNSASRYDFPRELTISCGVSVMRLIMCVVFALLASSAAQAQVDGLDRAKSVYQDFEQKQREVVDAAFDRKIKEATRDGDLEMTTTLKEEQAEFKKSRKLPESTEMRSFGAKYSKAVEAAQKKLADAYDKEIKSETRAGNLETAKKLQAELERLNSATAQLTLAAPAPKAAGAGNAAGNNANTVVVRSAVWKQDGRFGQAGRQTQDVTSMLQSALEQGTSFEPNQRTLSPLDGRAATKSVYLDMTVCGVTFQSRLAENSTMRIRAATDAELKVKGVKLGKTRMEAVQLVYQTEDGSTGTNKSVPILTNLINGAVVEVSTEVFGQLPSPQPKVAVFLFRVGQDVLEIRAAEGTQIGIKY